MTDITASFLDGGVTAFIRVQLNDSDIMGARSSLKILYHSFEKPLLPGHLFDFSLLIAMSFFCDRSNSFIILEFSYGGEV